MTKGATSIVRQRALVIGYGNALRGDDRVGLQVAAAVARWEVPGVQVLVVQQLTPELAEPVAGTSVVVFVDAYSADESDGIKVERLQPAGSWAALGHADGPRVVLGLARALYGRHPLAWLIGIPGVCFELGDQGAALSHTAERGMRAALDQIALLIRSEPTEVAHLAVGQDSNPVGFV
jgi:hydrogenase maturation protease